MLQEGTNSVQVQACARPAPGNLWKPWRRVVQTAFWPLAVAILCLLFPLALKAQVTATLSGTVQDTTGRVIPDAQVVLTNTATGEARTVTTNADGLYAFPSLVPGTYNIKASAKGFKNKLITDIVLNAGESRTIPSFTLEVGAAVETVTVSATSQMIPIETGSKVDVLSHENIENLALEGQDTSELLRVLPGVTNESGGLTNTAPSFSDLNITVDESAIGSGFDINGTPYRSGSTILFDGANMIDIGDMASALTIIEPEFTQEVTTQASNMNATEPFGPVVVSAISRSGSEHYHGDAFFNARNNALDANGWIQNNTNTPLGPAHYYYPGGSVGGPVPGTHKKLLFYGGYEKWLQNQGNGNVLTSYVPTPAMMSGDFSTDNTLNTDLCTHGFIQGTPPNQSGAGSWCNDLDGMILANGTTTATLPTPAATGSFTVGTNTYITNAGQTMPAAYLDPGAKALAKIWPAATSDLPIPACGGCNYYQPIVNVDNGWIYNFRIDYQWGDNTHVYGMFQQAYSSGFANGNGAHLYWTPGNSIPYPGGGEVEDNYGKTGVAHIVHTFNAETTNDFMFAWAYGSYPFLSGIPADSSRATLDYPYGKVFSTPSTNIPAYNSAGNFTFPDFSQASIFEDPVGHYEVKKEAPQFSDTLTKVWGRHTVQVGAFTQDTDNIQSSFTYDEDGIMSMYPGQNDDICGVDNAHLATDCTGGYTTGLGPIGSAYNATGNFVDGILTGYSESSSAPLEDVAQQTTAAFVDDTWKTSRRLTLDLGIRLEHVGHWYDRDGLGIAVFYPDRVLSDFYTGKYAPGYYWRGIDAGVPLSGQPNRFVYPDGRFGMSYDVFGTGNTVVRGGWGMYRFVTQVNTIANGATPTGTPREVLGYNLPGGFNAQMQSVSHLAAPVANCTPPATCGAQGGQWGMDPTDYGQPYTEAYNLTIDQRLPWNSMFEIAYVGSKTTQLVDAGEDIEGSNFNELANQNKTPEGALFQPDPVTGVTATNPENVKENPVGLGTAAPSETPTGNTLADYHPLGKAYSTNATYMIQNPDYGYYNGLQASWTKTTGRLTWNFNGTWSKALYTSLQENPFVASLNYGPIITDRPLVFNAVYTYNSGTLHYGNSALNYLGSGWTITGISTWQKGGYVPAFLGNGVPNFGNGSITIEQYNSGFPADTAGASCTPGPCSLSKDTGIGTGLGDATYFGTDEAVPIMPVLTCSPTSGLAKNQILNGACLNLPAVPAAGAISPNGGDAYPYMSMTPYFDNDLALYRTFHIYENQNVQFRVSAFDWLNHSLMTFSGSSFYTVNYNVNYTTKGITPNYSTTGTTAFGLMTNKSGLPYARVIELDAKYSF